VARFCDGGKPARKASRRRENGGNLQTGPQIRTYRLVRDLHSVTHLRTLLESTGTPFAVAAYGPRGVVFRQGDPADSVMHIENGRVRLVVTTADGREAICGLLGQGAFLGEDALVGRVVRRQTASAMTATEVLVVPKAPMLRLLHTQQAIRDRFIAHILARHIGLEADLSDQLLHSTQQRLARALLLLASCGERCACRCVLPDVSQTIIAEMVGTTRSRVNLFMRRFKKLGFIREDDGVLQVEPSLLQVVSDTEGSVSDGTAHAALRRYREPRAPSHS
jgi:CRP/FNR family transcriptional regulator, cyclic AMP receptor protein